MFRILSPVNCHTLHDARSITPENHNAMHNSKPFQPMLKRLLVSAALLAITASSQATVLWSQDNLPGTGLCPDGDISWFTDSQMGQVIRVRDFDQDCSVQNSERAEFNTPSSTNPLVNGGTYYVGWRTRYDGPVPSTWNTIMQFKCRCDQDQPIVID